MTARVSILVPTYNRARWLPQALDSALAQDYANLEVLVLDNASTDETPSLEPKYRADARVRWTRHAENLGMVRNWRAGLERCTGDWFLILSDDDYLEDPGYVGKAMALAARDPAIALVYANGWILDESTQARRELRLPFPAVNEGLDIFLSRSRVAPQDFTLCNILFRKDLALQEDAFHNPHNVSCDSELFLRLCLRGKVAVCHDFVSTYRVHSANLVDRVNSDYELLVNNIEFIMVPYLRALELGALSPEQARDWRRRLVGVVVSHVLRIVRERFPTRLRETVDLLEARYGRGYRDGLRLREYVRLSGDWLAGRLRARETA